MLWRVRKFDTAVITQCNKIAMIAAQIDDRELNFAETDIRIVSARKFIAFVDRVCFAKIEAVCMRRASRCLLHTLPRM